MTASAAVCAMERLVKRIIQMIGLGGLALLALAIGAREVLDYRNKADFNQAIWRNAPNCGRDGCDAECVRGHMVRDLTSRHLSPGISRSEILALLGNTATRQTNRGKLIEYDLGMCSGFRIDYDVLAILLDDNDRLLTSWTEQH
jgi:hypothetical protein